MDYSIYCDESCHLEHDNIPVMGLGAVYCETNLRHSIFKELREIKIRHGFKPYWELKWNAVSETRLSYYEDIIRYYFSNPHLHFRALIVTDKTKLNYDTDNHDSLYYKMYFDLIKTILYPSDFYDIYLDLKDTQGQEKVDKLKRLLCDINHYDFDKDIVSKIQLVRSHEVELIQLADFFIGAICYANRGLKTSRAKLRLIALIRELSGYSLLKSTLYKEDKMNIFLWKGGE